MAKMKNIKSESREATVRPPVIVLSVDCVNVDIHCFAKKKKKKNHRCGREVEARRPRPVDLLRTLEVQNVMNLRDQGLWLPLSPSLRHDDMSRC
jgi:hypothetical protein